MEFIRTIREKRKTSREKNISDMAHSVICLDDFDGNIYISYNGAPLIPVESTWTQKEILAKLEQTRNSFIAYKKKQAESMNTACLLW